MPMASDRPFEAFLAAARGAIAHFHLPIIHIPGSNPNPKQPQQEPQPDLRDEQCLRESEQLCNGVSGPLTARPEGRCRGEDADRDQEECVQVVGR